MHWVATRKNREKVQHGESSSVMKRKTEKELAILHVLSHISMGLTQGKEAKGYFVCHIFKYKQGSI